MAAEQRASLVRVRATHVKPRVHTTRGPTRLPASGSQPLWARAPCRVPAVSFELSEDSTTFKLDNGEFLKARAGPKP